MAEELAAPTQVTQPPGHVQSGTRFNEIEDGEMEIPNILDGMHTNTARDEIPKGGAELIQNGRVRDDWCGRRGGLTEIIGKPDSDQVIGVSAFFPTNRSPWIVRVTPNNIYATNDTSRWNQFTGDTPGVDAFNVDFAQFIDHLYAATRINKILKLDFGALSSSEIDQAPKAKYVTTFANRVVAAHAIDEPGKIFWSGRLEPEVWDPNEDISAGFENLVVGQSDAGDEITGIFGFENSLIILRERSIWEASRRPFARAPFKFSQRIGNQGCDLPNTAVRATTEGRGDRGVGGIIFADYQTRGVWFYRPGIRPQRISRAIDDELFEGIQDKDEVYAAFDPFNQEYHLRISSSRIWVYSLRHNAWSRDDGPDVSTLGGFQTIGDITVIDELSGVIDDLQGVIDDLSEDVVNEPGILKGTPTGEVLFHDRSQINDWDGSSFEFIFQPPNFGGISRQRSFMEGVARALVNTISGNGEIATELSTDGSAWRQTQAHQFSTDSSAQSVSHKNSQVTGEDIYWRIKSSQTDVRLFSYFIRLLIKSRHR